MTTISTQATFILVLLLASFASSGFAGEQEPDEVCQHLIPLAVQNLVRRDLPAELQVEWKYHYNDVMCESTGDMANLAILAVFENGEKYYGLFHLHFTRTGELMTPREKTAREWRQTQNESDWEDRWCRWMNSVYPHDPTQAWCRERMQ